MCKQLPSAETSGDKSTQMSKQYGLIIPGQQKRPTVQTASTREITRPSIFDESSSDSDSNAPPQLKCKSASMGPGVMERRIARRLQEKALAEDPTIFQYDELYDEMENKREKEEQTKSKEPKKPKYIGRLMECAERRKLENELRVERQVQKEREAEGEQFKDKESFVTSAYRKKLEEMRKLDEQNKRDEYLEAIGDVTKQKDLDGFYRHLYEQKTGSSKEVKKPELQPEITETGNDTNDEVAYKPIKSGKLPQQRVYRKRYSSDNDEGDKYESVMIDKETKKIHLQNNIDADSDFSIDDSSDSDMSSAEDANDGKLNKKEKIQQNSELETNSKTLPTDSSTTASNLELSKKEEEAEPDVKVDVSETFTPSSAKVEPSSLKPKRDKSEIWRKRTVGEVFEAAVKRYYERKAARSA